MLFVFLICIFPFIRISKSFEECNADFNLSKEKYFKDKIIPVNYEKMIHPNYPRGKTMVYLAVLYLNILRISEVDQELQVSFLLIQRWKDERLNHPSSLRRNKIVYVHKEMIESLWTPKFYFYPVKDAKVLTFFEPGVFLYMYENDLIFTIRFSAVLHCTMDFVYYPFDIHDCFLKIESADRDRNEVDIKWSNESLTKKYTMENSVREFSVKTTVLPDQLFTDHLSNKTILTLKISLSRKINGYLFSDIFPYFIFMFIAWVCLLIPPRNVQPRVILSVTTMLTITTHNIYITSKLPPSPYIRAIDMWYLVTLISCGIILISIAFSARYEIYKAKLNSKKEEKLGCWVWISKKMIKINENLIIIFPIKIITFSIIFFLFVMNMSGKD